MGQVAKSGINKYEAIKKGGINMEKISKKEIKDALSNVMHPEISYNLLKLGMIKDIEFKENKVNVTLLLPFLGIPIKEDLLNLTKESIRNLNKNIKIEIKTAEINEKEKEKFMKMAKDGWML